MKVIIPQGGKCLWEKFCDFDLAKSFAVVDSGKKDLSKNLSRKVLSIFFKQESLVDLLKTTKLLYRKGIPLEETKLHFP